jgi:hypothetical protein
MHLRLPYAEVQQANGSGKSIYPNWTSEEGSKNYYHAYSLGGQSLFDSKGCCDASQAKWEEDCSAETSLGNCMNTNFKKPYSGKYKEMYQQSLKDSLAHSEKMLYNTPDILLNPEKLQLGK